MVIANQLRSPFSDKEDYEAYVRFVVSCFVDEDISQSSNNTITIILNKLFMQFKK